MFISMDEIRSIYHYAVSGETVDWFAPQPLRRIAENGYLSPDRQYAYFVSSERTPRQLRRYFVHCMDLNTGNISTSTDRKYSTRNGANKAAQRTAALLP